MAFISMCVLLVLAVYSNAEYPGDIDGPVRLNHTVAVIGGGISAIHMASLMKQKGFTKIHILVEQGRLGGDEVQTKVHRGTNHEMGKHMFIPASVSKEVDDAMQRYGQGVLTEIPLPTVWEEDAQKKLIAKTLDTYLQDKAKQQSPGLTDTRKMLVDKIGEFQAKVSSLFPSVAEEIPSEPSWTQKFQLSGSFKKFLEDNNFQALLPMFTYLFSMMGYGRPEDFAAYYGIYFFKPEVLNTIKQRLSTTGVTGIPGFKINSRGMEKLLDTWVQNERMNVSKNVRIDNIEIGKTRPIMHRIKMNINGVDKTGEYSFIVFAEDFRKYIKLNSGRSQREYQLFLRPRTKYIIKTLVDSLDVPRGDSPVDYYVESFKSGGATDYKVAYGIDSFATYNGNSGSMYKQNLMGNSNDPSDQNRSQKSAVYTQMANTAPNVGTANAKLLSFLRASGGKNLAVIDTKVHRFFPHYMDRDLNNGMTYDILKMQGKNGVWYIGKSAYLDNIVSMMGYNKMILNKYKLL